MKQEWALATGMTTQKSKILAFIQNLVKYIILLAACFMAVSMEQWPNDYWLTNSELLIQKHSLKVNFLFVVPLQSWDSWNLSIKRAIIFLKPLLKCGLQPIIHY